MNYYEHYCGDYARDTSHLSLAEHGAYRLLLDVYYSTSAPLPESIESLCRMCHAMNSSERASVVRVADQFFQVGADGLRHNYRADLELEKAMARIERSQTNGLRGGRKRKNPAGNPAGNPVGCPAQTQTGEALPHATSHSSSLRSEQPAREKAALPDWLPGDAWLAFDEMRHAKSGKAWTQRAKEIAFGKLEKLKKQGFDPADVLLQSVLNSWSGLFPIANDRVVKTQTNGHFRAERQANSMDILTGKVRDERTVEGSAERVDHPLVLTLPGDLRESNADDVEGRGPSRGPVGLVRSTR